MLQGNKIVVRRHMPLAPEIPRCLHNSYHPLGSPQAHWNMVWHGPREAHLIYELAGRLMRSN
jgi:hypothetical protein